MKRNKVVVIGGGAAGMMAAISAAGNGADVTLIERNEKLGKKIYITGKGRCNVTNNCDEDEFFNNIVSNPRFMYGAFYSFDNRSLMELLENNGLKLKVERGGRVFPESDHSYDVTDTLRAIMKRKGVKVRLNTTLKAIITDAEKVRGIETMQHEKITADSVIMCTGGLSYSSTGSDGNGHKLLHELGHTLTDTKPALVPLTTKEEFYKDLQGLSLKNVRVNLFNEVLNSEKIRAVADGARLKKSIVFSGFGEMLFTHFGISGPLILSASSFYSKKVYGKQVTLLIDLKPALTVEQLDKRIVRDFDNAMNKSLKNALSGLLPSGIIDTIIVQSLLDAHKPVHDITKEERSRLVYTIKGLNMTVTGTRPFTEAIITQGGINVKEINPSTMESKLIPGMYIAGELMDVDALTGGFNLQVAWSSGYLAGMSAATKQGE